MKATIIAIVILGAAAGGWWWWTNRDAPAATASFRTAEVTRTVIMSTISATGTVVPEDVIDVGTQVNGPIASFGVDTDGKIVDYRSTVTAGSLLAKIDDTVYAADVAAGEAQLAQAQAQVQVGQANLAQARANHAQALANLTQAQAKSRQADRDWARAQKLGSSKAMSQADYDAARSAQEQAEAGIAVAQAAIEQAEAGMRSAEAGIRSAEATIKSADAALARSRRNLAFCTISAPVTGVIIDRRVEIGQTVVSSMNAQSLFLIAKDLSRMQVLVPVNEADIGHVVPGEPVTFTNDAFPGETFRGEVRKVRLNATMTQNVVTYTVEIATENKDLRLLPYLTANVRFIVDQRNDVLAVPSAALRWSPPGAPAAAASRPARGGAGRRGSPGTVWILDEGRPRAVAVRVGLSDGTMTEVESEDLKEGDAVITGEQAAGGGGRPAGESGSTNPFAPPTPFGGRRR